MKLFVAMVMMLMLAGCATLSDSGTQLTYQYGTMKLIESESVTAADVIDRTASVRAALDGTGEITSGDLYALVKDEVGYDDLAPSDKLLVDTLVGDMLNQYELGADDMIDAELMDEVIRRLDWIEQSAYMSE